MNRSEPEASVGKICAFVAASRRCGRSRFVVWVDCMVSAFGRKTWIPVEVFLCFREGYRNGYNRFRRNGQWRQCLLRRWLRWAVLSVR